MFKRLLSLTLGLGLAFASFQYVHFSSWQIGEVVQDQKVTVQAKQPELVCAGPVNVNGGSTGLKLGNFVPLGTAQVLGNVTLDSASIANQKLLIGDGQGSKNFNAVQWQSVDTTQGFGLAAANCQPGSGDAWLVAGDGSVGREALILLANPTSVDATVTLQIFGTNGPIAGSGQSGISAPAGKLTVLPISAFAPKASTFAIHVTSRGAALGIWLQQKTVRGLAPGGIDLIGPAANPAKDVFIPGIFLRGVSAIAKKADGTSDFADTKAILRVTAPGTKQATFTAQIQGSDDKSVGTVISQTVPAGTTRDFELSDLTDGNYTVTINSDQPVSAAVRFNRSSSKNTDFAWAVASSALKLDSGFTSPAGSTTKLSLINTAAKSVTVTLDGVTHQISANTSIVLAVSAGKAHSISSDGRVAASQVVDIKSAIAVIPVIDYRNVGGVLKVSVR